MLVWCPPSHVTPFERIHTVMGGPGFIWLLVLTVSVAWCDMSEETNLVHFLFLCQGSIHLVGWGASLLIGEPVGIDREAKAGPLDAVLRLRLVELVPCPPLLLLLPLLPLLAPVASFLGTFRAELRRPRGGLRGGAPSPAVLSALRGCCRGNLPANQSTNTVVMATPCLSQRLSWTGVEEKAWQLRAAAAAAWRTK